MRPWSDHKKLTPNLWSYIQIICPSARFDPIAKFCNTKQIVRGIDSTDIEQDGLGNGSEGDIKCMLGSSVVFGWHVFYGVEWGFERWRLHQWERKAWLGLSPRSSIIGQWRICSAAGWHVMQIIVNYSKFHPFLHFLHGLGKKSLFTWHLFFPQPYWICDTTCKSNDHMTLREFPRSRCGKSVDIRKWKRKWKGINSHYKVSNLCNKHKSCGASGNHRYRTVDMADSGKFAGLIKMSNIHQTGGLGQIYQNDTY